MATGFWLWEKTFVPDRAAHNDMTALPCSSPRPGGASPSCSARVRSHCGAARSPSLLRGRSVPWECLHASPVPEGQERQIRSWAWQETP